MKSFLTCLTMLIVAMGCMLVDCGQANATDRGGFSRSVFVDRGGCDRGFRGREVFVNRSRSRNFSNRNFSSRGRSFSRSRVGVPLQSFRSSSGLRFDPGFSLFRF